MPAGQARPTSLGVFDGTGPNGTWRLFGYDRNGGDVSAMDGWSLHIRWSDNASPSGRRRPAWHGPSSTVIGTHADR